jgi:Holliday junction resolvasome RuvABC endonuclease subunit
VSLHSKGHVGFCVAQCDGKSFTSAIFTRFGPSDFYLFGHVKQLLRGYGFADREALVHAIQNILRGIEKVILENVSLNWMERLLQYGSATGEYVE